MEYNISIIGLGYVGTAISVLISQKYNVVAMDIDEEKVSNINNRKSPTQDSLIQDYFNTKSLKLSATTILEDSVKNSNFIIICLPTDYNSEIGTFDTNIIDATIGKILSINSVATIVIKSTVSIGFTRSMKEKYNIENIIFSPEFLREGYALHDNLYPNRIVVGTDLHNANMIEKSNAFIDILKTCSCKETTEVLVMDMNEAEAVKLFSNTYLAMRVSFFNELDTFAEQNNMNTKHIIDGIGLDSRIGPYYNNPSFGYGGYCLPKDSKALLSSYEQTPQDMITATVKSNDTRKQYIANKIILKCKLENIDTVGIYRLSMKENSDNFRESSILDIIKLLKLSGLKIYIYEPTLDDCDTFMDCDVIHDLSTFKKNSKLIVANRMSHDIADIENVYTRDVSYYI